jgi:hypothetical protein
MAAYSVWIVPPEPLFSKFSTLIESLAVELGTVKFVPHITLVGGINLARGTVLELVRSLSTELHPYVMPLGKMDYSDEFFRSLFVRVKCTRDVKHGYDRASRVLPSGRLGRYEPHLSLMYGNVSSQVKMGLIERIGSRMSDSFLAENLCIYETDPGDVTGWHQLEQLPLLGQGEAS